MDIWSLKNLACLKIHEDCFSICNSILDDMKNLITIEYMKGSTNLILNFPYYNHLYNKKFNKIKSIKIMGDYSYMEERPSLILNH